MARFTLVVDLDAFTDDVRAGVRITANPSPPSYPEAGVGIHTGPESEVTDASGVATFDLVSLPDLTYLVTGDGFDPVRISGDRVDGTTVRLDEAAEVAPSVIAPTTATELRAEIADKADAADVAAAAETATWAGVSGKPTEFTPSDMGIFSHLNNASSFSSIAVDAISSTAAQNEIAAQIANSSSDLGVALASAGGGLDAGEVSTAIATEGVEQFATLGTDITQQLMGVLATESRDASLLVLGDSTGNETTEWVYLAAQWLAAQYPAWTVQYRLWNDGTTAYATASTIQTGSGSRTLTIYNASVSGFTTTSWQGLRATTAIAALNPDLCFISLGHNEGAVTTAAWHSRYVGLTEEVSLQLAGTPICLIAQNPATANTYQQQRRDVYREIALHRGYGFIDVCKAFEDYGSDLTADGIHPNATGSALWRDTVTPHLRHQPGLTPHPVGTSTLGVRGSNLLVNADFSAVTGGVPDNWGLTNITAAVDTTNYESSSLNRVTLSGGYTSTAQKFTGTGAGQAQLFQYVPVNLVKGKWVTVAARIYVPTGQSGNVARLALVDSAGSTINGSDTQHQGKFRWAVATRFIDASATNCRVLLYVDSGATGTGNCTVDRVSMVVGKYPLAP